VTSEFMGIQKLADFCGLIK